MFNLTKWYIYKIQNENKVNLHMCEILETTLYLKWTSLLLNLLRFCSEISIEYPDSHSCRYFAFKEWCFWKSYGASRVDQTERSYQHRTSHWPDVTPWRISREEIFDVPFTAHLYFTDILVPILPCVITIFMICYKLEIFNQSSNSRLRSREC